MKILRLVLLFTAAAIAASGLLYALPSGKAPPPSKIFNTRVLDANAWEIYTTNYGPFVKPQTGSGGFWPAGSGRGYIYGAGLWVGAILSTGDTAISQGYDCANGGYEFCPYPHSLFDDPMVRVYLSTNPTDLAEWPVVENGRKVIRSVQDSWCRYSDDDPQFNFAGSGMLYVMVEQFSYAWNYADNNDVVFFYFRVKNISNKVLNKVYLGPTVDCDIGDEGGVSNDRTIFDYQRNLAIQFQTEPESGWPETGVVGFRYFESPINNTGDIVHVIDNQYSHDIAPNQPLGLTAFKIITLTQDPSTDKERYIEMSGINYWDMVMDAYDEWGALTPGDKRFIMSSGPFILKPDSTVTSCIGIIGALDTTALKTASDLAQVIYDNDFMLAEAPAIPALTVASGDGQAFLIWDRAAETTPDPYWEKIPDMVAWHYYFQGTWQNLPDSSKLLVDSFEIKTGSTTFARIARGDLNPTGGTDTTAAFYNQKSLYQPNDFQGYLIYRADNLEGLADPLQRSPVGTFFRSSIGAGGYFYDKADGIQVVLDINKTAYHTVDSIYYLPAYDTIGADRGLVTGLVDDGLINGRRYYYGVSAYDYQPCAYFTHKCPVTMASDPRRSARPVVSWKKPFGYLPPQIAVRVDGGSDSRHGGALDYLRNLAAVAPGDVKRDSFKLRWTGMGKTYDSSQQVYCPAYKGLLYASDGALLDSLKPHIVYNSSGYLSGHFAGTGIDQLPFGGIVFQPEYLFDPIEAAIDSFTIRENPYGATTYPIDSVSVSFIPAIFSAKSNAWQWRGSDFEIRWKDTLAGLTAEVWDLTNNTLVPLETGVTKVNMVQSSWCFNPTSLISSAAILTSTSSDAYGMHICGVTIYFNKAGTVLRRMDWPNRPETGDIWRIYCSGPTTPAEGALATFILTPETPDDGLAHLQQNYPNPFNNTGTNIFYQVSGNGPVPVNLKIYNIAGQLVRTVVSENKAPGYYRASWNGIADNGQKVSAGIYLYRLQAGGKSLTKKMVLIK